MTRRCHTITRPSLLRRSTQARYHYHVRAHFPPRLLAVFSFDKMDIGNITHPSRGMAEYSPCEHRRVRPWTYTTKPMEPLRCPAEETLDCAHCDNKLMGLSLVPAADMDISDMQEETARHRTQLHRLGKCPSFHWLRVAPDVWFHGLMCLFCTAALMHSVSRTNPSLPPSCPRQKNHPRRRRSRPLQQQRSLRDRLRD